MNLSKSESEKRDQELSKRRAIAFGRLALNALLRGVVKRKAKAKKELGPLKTDGKPGEGSSRIEEAVSW